VNLFHRARITMCAAIAFLSLAVPQIARADEGHLPIIDFRPVATWADTGNTTGLTGGGLPGVANGGVELTGSATIPLFRGLSFSFDRNAGGLIWSTLGPFSGIQPGSFKDNIEDYRLDYVVNRSFSVEASLANRHRECCPGSADPNNPASSEWHTGNLGLTYTTPSFKFLNHGVFVLGVTGHTANHNPSPNAEAGFAPGQSIGHVREYGVSQAATVVYPIDIKNRLTATATYTWGALDYFENAPFPWSYKIWIFGLNKTVNPYLGFELQAFNLTQGEQGSPFPTPNTIHEVSYALTANIHLDLNRILGPPTHK
jgi:hypothetical protein